MKTIWKFPLSITDFQKIQMPKGAKVLTAAMQGELLCLWALVDDDAPKVEAAFWVLGTGNPIDHPKNIGEHIATVPMHGGMLIWHVFHHIYR